MFNSIYGVAQAAGIAAYDLVPVIDSGIDALKDGFITFWPLLIPVAIVVLIFIGVKNGIFGLARKR